MVKRLLVIDRDEQGQFYLSVESGVLTVGGNSKNAEVVFRDLHISRIHCEVEVEEDRVLVCQPETRAGQGAGAAPLRQELRPGEALQIGQSHLCLKGVAADATAEGPVLPETSVLPEINDEMLVEKAASSAEATEAAAKSPAVPPSTRLLKQLVVIDGADRGRAYSLPDEGRTTLGQSKKSADIVLHDLFVARVHCELHVEDDHVFVTHLNGDNGTLINGQKIGDQHELKTGDVLRIGNSQMRFEILPIEEGSSDESEEDEEAIEVVAEDGEDEYEVEVVEDESEAAEVEPAEAAPADSDDPYSLPHGPVDQLLKLEGQSFGRFQIGPLLGRGHTSLVYRALDSKTQQLVALKVLSPDFPSVDAEMQRFLQALKTLSVLHNPYLPSLVGAGKVGPYCWIAREYVEGENLAKLVQRLAEGGRLDWTRACRVALHLGKALDFLHKQRITHGNITPRNVLIRKSDRMTKLTDLMLNRALEGSKLQKAILGKKLLAELPFLAPEQTDPHAPGSILGDMYSVGAVVYALITGQRPFTGDTPREVVARIREGKVVRPSKLQRGIPAPFEAAVLLMMARRPEERFQTAGEMLDSLQRLADEHEIEV